MKRLTVGFAGHVGEGYQGHLKQGGPTFGNLAVPNATGTTLRVETVFGWGAFSRLRWA